MCIFIHSSKGEILRAFLSSSRENIVSGNPVLYQRWPPKTVGIFIHSSKGEILLAFLSSSRGNILSGNPVFFSSEMATKTGAVLYQRWPPKTVCIFIYSSKGEILRAFLYSSRE